MNLITILCLDFLGLSFFIRVYDKELIAEPNSYMTLRQLWFSIWSMLNITFARFYRLSFILHFHSLFVWFVFTLLHTEHTSFLFVSS